MADTLPMTDARKILVAFAMREGLDELSADLAVSETIAPRGVQPVSLTTATEVLDELAARARPTTQFDFTDMLGRHVIRVSGVNADGRVKVAIYCGTCKEALLTSSDATVDQAIAAVENHG